MVASKDAGWQLLRWTRHVKKKNKDNKIPVISVLNNFHYEESGIPVWKAYNIRLGRFIPFDDLAVVPQGKTGLKVIQSFGLAPQRGRMDKSVRHKSEIYSCQETGCVLTFKNQSEADYHMDTGKHRLEVDYESTYDRIRRKWAEVVTGVMFAQDNPVIVIAREQCHGTRLSRS